MLEKNRSGGLRPQDAFPITLISLIVGLLAGGYLVLSSKNGLSGLVQQATSPNATYHGLPTDDGDHDGLTNEEEVKLGTDPEKADTDSDSYLDGEEIISGHNPLKAGPDDELSSSDYLNLTKKFKGELKKAIATGKISLQDESQNSYNNLSAVATQLQPILLQTFSLPESLVSQIKVSSDNSQNKITEYQTNVQAIIDKNFGTLKGKKEITFQDFNNYYATLDNTLYDFRNLTVPSNVLNRHKEMMFLIWTAKKNIEAAKNYDQDPLKAIIAAQNLNSLLNPGLK